MSLAVPPRWSGEELDRGRAAAVAAFRHERLRELPERYTAAVDRSRAVVDALLTRTADLARLDAGALDVLTDPELLEAVRYLASPPISADDLTVLAETALSPARLRESPACAARVVGAVRDALDHRRFPWVAAGRPPAPAEREAAVLATAVLLASRWVLTERASTARERQEGGVAGRLLGEGFREVPAPAVVPTLAQAPPPGCFCRETTFGRRKADLLVGLWDGRQMPIECKVSNSELNSIKRLNNDAAVKATEWIRDFGEVSVVPAAVLSGVYKRRHLERAQLRGLTLFWAGDLDRLARFIATTRDGDGRRAPALFP